MSEDGKPGRLLHHWRLVGRASLDAGLSRVDVAVLWCVLQAINSKTGRAFTSLERLAELAGVSARSVPRSLKRLCDHGYLVKEFERGSNRSSIYSAVATDKLVTDESVSDESVSDTSVTDENAGVALTDSSVYALTDSSDISASYQLQYPTSVKALDRFPDFWASYPRKEGKAKAAKVWKAQKLDKPADRIIKDVLARLSDPQHWTDAQYIPHPATYLNQRRWEDEWTRSPLGTSNVVSAEFGRLPRETQENADAINAASAKRLGIKP